MCSISQYYNFMILNCFVWGCFLEPFFDISDSIVWDCFVLDCFVYAPTIHNLWHFVTSDNSWLRYCHEFVFGQLINSHFHIVKLLGFYEVFYTRVMVFLFLFFSKFFDIHFLTFIVMLIHSSLTSSFDWRYRITDFCLRSCVAVVSFVLANFHQILGFFFQ